MKCLQKRNGKNPRWRNDKLSSSPPPSNIWLVWLLLVVRMWWTAQKIERDGVVSEKKFPLSWVSRFSSYSHFSFFIFLRCHQHTIMAHLNPIRNSLDKLHQLFEERIFRVIFTLATYHWLFKELRWVDKNGFLVRHSNDDYALKFSICVTVRVEFYAILDALRNGFLFAVTKREVDADGLMDEALCRLDIATVLNFATHFHRAASTGIFSLSF